MSPHVKSSNVNDDEWSRWISSGTRDITRLEVDGRVESYGEKGFKESLVLQRTRRPLSVSAHACGAFVISTRGVVEIA